MTMTPSLRCLQCECIEKRVQAVRPEKEWRNGAYGGGGGAMASRDRVTDAFTALKTALGAIIMLDL